MNILVLPSIITLILKVLILLWSHKTDQSKDFKYLLIFFAIHNVCEISLFLQGYLPHADIWSIRAYYCASVLSAAYMVVYGAKIAHFFELRMLKVVMSLLVIIPCFMIALSDVVVAGNELSNGKYFAIRGSLYGVFSGFVVICQLTMGAFLYYGYKNNNETPLIKIQCLYAGLSLLPIAITVLAVIAIQSFGGSANTTTMLPLTTLFLLMIAISEQKYGLTDIRKWIPFSLQWRLANKVAKLKFLYNTGQIDFKKYIDLIEKFELVFALQSSNQSVTATARKLGIKRSTVYSMMKRHNVNKDMNINMLHVIK